MNPLYISDELPLCLQIHSCSTSTLWCRLTPPMSPDIHFTVIFPYSSNLTFVNNGKDSSFWEETGLWALWEITSKSWGVIAIPRVFRKERWWAVTLSLFKGLQMKFSSLSSLCSQLPNFFFKGKMFFTEERDVEVSSDDMLYDSSSLAMG